MKLTTEEGLRRLSMSRQTYAKLFQHGSLMVEIYQPRKVDLQEPHDQDELYVIISGTGTFVRGTKRNSCGAGDVLFVPAGETHFFEDFTDDFCTWVFFYGAKGGEKTNECANK